MDDGRTAAATVGVIGLAIVAAGLAYLALTGHSTSSTTPSANVHVAITSPATPSLGSSATTSPTATATDAAPTDELPLSVVSATTAWRSTRGSCSGGSIAHVQVTTDGGATWHAAGTPPVEVVTLAATDARHATEVGYDAGCRLVMRTTANGGKTWLRATTIEGVWTHELTTVRSPTGTTATPCTDPPVVTTDGIGSTSAYVLCPDGAIYRTTDGGTTFTKRSKLAGTVALGGAGAGDELAAVTGTTGCDGVLVRRSADGAKTWTTGYCVVSATDTADVGIDLSAANAWLVSGTHVYRSTDGGSTWTRVDS